MDEDVRAWGSQRKGKPRTGDVTCRATANLPLFPGERGEMFPDRCHGTNLIWNLGHGPSPYERSDGGIF